MKCLNALVVLLGLGICLLAGCGPAVSVDPAILQAANELKTTAVAEQLRDAGDGLAARRARIPELFPQVAVLVAAGSDSIAAILPNFSGEPDIGNDEALSIYAYVLEQIGDPTAVPDLVGFLRQNTTGEVVSALSSVTHAIRELEGLPAEQSAAYLMSEIQATIATLSDDTFKTKLEPAQQGVASQGSCSGEFYLLDGNGARIQDPFGKELRVGGTMLNPTVDQGFATSAPGRRLATEVVSQGGTPFNYVDPQSGITWRSEPTRRFNCAGFAFRKFVRGKPWLADPGRMFAALSRANLLMEVDAAAANAGDFAFFTQEGQVAHVAEVETADTGILGSGITVINADGPTGMFRANVTAEWYQKYGGVGYYRWRGGPPNFEPVSDLSRETSCFEADLDGDGQAELAGAGEEACVTHSDCPAGRFCVAGRCSDQACTPGIDCDIPCVEDSDCPAGQFCANNFNCYPL